GFGKWRFLPEPSVEAFLTESSFDYLWGNHNGYDSIDVQYSREILFLRDGFWIIRDHFRSNTPHTYQQIWQGDFQIGDDRRLYRRFLDPDVTLNIIQLLPATYDISRGAFREKKNTMVSHGGDAHFRFTTLLAVTTGSVLPGRDEPEGFLSITEGWQLKFAPHTRFQLDDGRMVEGELLIDHQGTEFWILGARRIDGKVLSRAVDGTAAVYINVAGEIVRLH
ncbi:MAG: hypothetical protein JSW54_06730, partial [Fidelibacterota bacterium]